MGDRFVLIRIDSREGAHAAGAQAIRNTGSEVEMREELAEVVGGLTPMPAPTTCSAHGRREGRLLEGGRHHHHGQDCGGARLQG